MVTLEQWAPKVWLHYPRDTPLCWAAAQWRPEMCGDVVPSHRDNGQNIHRVAGTKGRQETFSEQVWLILKSEYLHVHIRYEVHIYVYPQHESVHYDIYIYMYMYSDATIHTDI